MYPYDAPPATLLKAINGTLIDYAADEFQSHCIGRNAPPFWQFKRGTRPSG
ncbi:MAG: hypothetical protein AAF231_16050 [Pseudomonadota bacterium]